MMNIPGKTNTKKSIVNQLLSLRRHGQILRGKLVSGLSRFGCILRQKASIIALVALVLIIPVLVRTIVWTVETRRPISGIVDEQELIGAEKNLNREIALLDIKLKSKRPRSYFLVINSASNEFVLYRDEKIIQKDKCSTGSYILLKNGEQQQWMFNTPRGAFRIQGKITSPVWKKPDWAFIEEGLPVPSANHYTRFEYGVLGDYALSLGHGYLIHGTLYQRFLGLPVTHGCIRLNDANLELIYQSLQVGSRVYIY